MDIYAITKVLHILSATVLFGTGLGTAFFMFRTRSSSDLQSKYDVTRTTVLADYVFTTPAVIVQPLTGIALIRMAGFDGTEFWLIATYVIYVLVGLCWLPVVWIQVQLKNMVLISIQTGNDLPDRYDALFRTWFILGWPAFLGLVVVFFLMVSKPTW